MCVSFIRSLKRHFFIFFIFIFNFPPFIVSFCSRCILWSSSSSCLDELTNLRLICVLWLRYVCVCVEGIIILWPKLKENTTWSSYYTILYTCMVYWTVVLKTNINFCQVQHLNCFNIFFWENRFFMVSWEFVGFMQNTVNLFFRSKSWLKS